MLARVTMTDTGRGGMLRVLTTAKRVGLGIALLSLLVGCSDGRPGRVKASGYVTIDGSPLKYGSVLFVPDKGRPAAGGLDSEGHFVLTCFEPEDGIVPGKYRVQIKGTEPIGENAQRWHAPMKYADVRTSGIVREIDGPIDSLLFELTWDGGKPFVEHFR